MKVSFAVVLILLISPLVLSFLLPDKEQDPAPEFDTELKADAPLHLYENGEYNFGRYAKPIVDPNIHKITKLQKKIQKKEWHFLSISTPHALIGLAISQLNYAATSFIYVLTDDWTDQKQIMRPLGFGASFSESSVKGCSKWNDKIAKLVIEVCNFKDTITVQAEGTLNDSNFIKVSAVIDTNSDSLALAYPIGPHRVAYTLKQAGMPVRGYYKLKDRRYEFGEDAVAIQDWTRALPKRLTVWYWISINFVSKNKRIGVNLSHGMYPKRVGNQTLGLENGIWVDGNLHLVESELIVDGEPGTGVLDEAEEWHCRTKDGSLKLTYRREGATVSGLDVKVLKGKLIHSYGTYSGVITIDGEKHVLKNVKGILEDHYTLW